jgi:hypothetical protein
MANSPAEIAALETRCAQARTTADTRGHIEILAQLEEELGHSVAIISMPASRLQSLVADPESLLSTFSLQVEGQSRVPRDNRFDAIRASVEEAFFPNYSKEIRFAALSLTEVGHAAYGCCSARLKASAIQTRASLLDAPLFAFAQIHNIQLGTSIPEGHRAAWARKSKLATAKFGDKLPDGNIDFATLLLPKPTDTLTDCIEVHIFGPLHQLSFDHIHMTKATRKADRLIQRAILAALSDSDIQVEIA